MLLSSLGSTSEAIDDPIRPLHTVLPPPLMVPKYNTLTVIILYHRLKHTRFLHKLTRYTCCCTHTRTYIYYPLVFQIYIYNTFTTVTTLYPYLTDPEAVPAGSRPCILFSRMRSV